VLFALQQAMVDLVSQKLGQDAGSVLAAMLAHASRSETGVAVSGKDLLSCMLCKCQCGHCMQCLVMLGPRAQLRSVVVDKVLQRFTSLPQQNGLVLDTCMPRPCWQL